jgi:hypothetical protein
MGANAPKQVSDIVERFERDRKVFLSRGPEQAPSPKTPNEQESLRRTIAATACQIDALVYELSGLTEDEIRIMEGGRKRAARNPANVRESRRRKRP